MMEANEESSEDDLNEALAAVVKGPSLMAVSASFHNPEDLVQFVLSGLFARGLKKGIFFAPDPYVKFKIGPGYGDHNSVYLPHHGQNCRTTMVENTTDPRWPSQVLLITLKTSSSILGVISSDWASIFFVAIHICWIFF
jgi:hypothetical protein